jgi:hypothetical protein
VPQPNQRIANGQSLGIEYGFFQRNKYESLHALS